MTREEEFSDRLNARASFIGCTSLHYAVLINSEDLVHLLLEAGKSGMNDLGVKFFDLCLRALKNAKVKDCKLSESGKALSKTE